MERRRRRRDIKLCWRCREVWLFVALSGVAVDLRRGESDGSRQEHDEGAETRDAGQSVWTGAQGRTPSTATQDVPFLSEHTSANSP